MKKVALSLLAFGLIGAGAFAQAAPAAPTVTIGDWGVQAFGIGNQDKSGYWADVGSSWDSTPRIVGLNIQAKTDTAGFSITPSADNGTFSLTDQNKAWINPFPGWTVEGGIQLETDTWRGTNDFGSDDWIRFAGFQQNSYTFFRLGEGGEAFDINYNKDGIGAWALVSAPTSGATTDIGHSLQAGAAYTFASIGQIKAQYVGYEVAGTGLQTISAGASALNTPNYSLDSKTGLAVNNPVTTDGVGSGTEYGKYQIAFNLSAVKDLTEEVGVTLPSNASDAGWSFQLSDFFDYKVDKVTLHGVVILTSFNGDNKDSSGSSNDSGIGAAGSVGADYDLGNSYTLTGSLTYENALASVGGSGSGDALTGILVGVSKGFSNGSIGVGFEYSTSTIGASDSSGATNSNAGDAHWAIPIVLHEWF